MRLFLLWYQILGDSASVDLQPLYEALVPGVVPPHAGSIVFASAYEPAPASVQAQSASYFYADTQSSRESQILSAASVQPVELDPLVPIVPGEVQPKDITCYYLQALMDFMVSQVAKVQWKEQRESMQLRCFQYLFEQFRRTYIRHIFPDLNDKYTLYTNALFELPMFRPSDRDYFTRDPQLLHVRESQANAKAAVIRWFARYMNDIEAIPRLTNIGEYRGPRMVVDMANDWRDPTPFEVDIVRTTLNASRANVNLTNEMFRQAFLLPFTQAITTRMVVAAIKNWVTKTNISERKCPQPHVARCASQSVFRCSASVHARAHQCVGAGRACWVVEMYEGVRHKRRQRIPHHCASRAIGFDGRAGRNVQARTQPLSVYGDESGYGQRDVGTGTHHLVTSAEH